MNSCIDCAHAKWERTSNGRVNPHKVGECMWRKVVYVPLSLNAKPLELNGGAIWRKRPKEKCPTYLSAVSVQRLVSQQHTEEKP